MFPSISLSDEAMMLADVIDMVSRETPVIFAVALVCILVAMWLTLGSLKLSLLCLAPTLISMVALFGLMPVFGLSFNYLDIILLTFIVGVTVDAGVHLITRLTAPGEDRIAAFAETGRAISGGILASAAGFGAMWRADHPGLQSVGKLANLGFATNLLVMLVVFPVLTFPARPPSPDRQPGP